MNKKIIGLALWGLMICGKAVACPALPTPVEVKQPDGTTVTVYLRGDETFSYYEDLDGNVLTTDERGLFRKASHFEKEEMMGTWKECIAERNATYTMTETTTPALRMEKRTAPVKGQRRALVLLANFTDVKMSSNNTQEAFNNQFNKEGYSANNHVGSVRDFYLKMSYGALTIDFDVVGPYALSHNLAYYGAKSGSKNDARPGEMVKEVLQLADNDVDYTKYDWDGDGTVDQVMVIFAGYSQAQGGSTDALYPHAWTLSGSGAGSIRLDGKTINRYAISSELKGSSGTTMDGIGAACHEFSHTIGLRDMYDVNSGTCYGTGFWDPMCYGLYNGDNSIPAGYTAFERMQMGWLNPTVLDEPQKIENLAALIDTAMAYIVYNDSHKDEYYLLEFRMPTSFDTGCKGKGLLITHVDYVASAWNNAEVNVDPNHQHCAVVAADNDYDKTIASSAKDVYPCSTNRNFTDSSTPASTLFYANTDGRKFLGKAIESINISKNMIRFKFMGGDTPLGIGEVDEGQGTEDIIFTLNGQRTTRLQKGINIVGGKKVIY